MSAFMDGHNLFYTFFGNLSSAFAIFVFLDSQQTVKKQYCVKIKQFSVFTFAAKRSTMEINENDYKRRKR